MARRQLNMRASYAAADEIPYKLVMHPLAPQLRPIHVQWMPTNKCNLKCLYCSCAERDESIEMDLGESAPIMQELARRGCQAVTITGGGEPLCHPEIARMIEQFHSLGIKIGLVTNGILLHKLDRKTISMLTWCRISHDDHRPFSSSYQSTLAQQMQVDVDWAFSYVIGDDPHIGQIEHLVQFAKLHGCTHIRIVTDILSPNASAMDDVKAALKNIDDLIIYQARCEPEPGDQCLIGYVKPVIGPDWKIAPCCGYQYAFTPPPKSLPGSMVIGDARDLAAFYDDPQPHDFGCAKCYYTRYNHAFVAIRGGLSHRVFV